MSLQACVFLLESSQPRARVRVLRAAVPGPRVDVEDDNLVGLLAHDVDALGGEAGPEGEKDIDIFGQGLESTG